MSGISGATQTHTDAVSRLIRVTCSDIAHKTLLDDVLKIIIFDEKISNCRLGYVLILQEMDKIRLFHSLMKM